LKAAHKNLLFARPPILSAARVIRGKGYVVQSLEAALWAFAHSSSFAEGCLMAVNQDDDADTTAAVYPGPRQ
jgi:ADP-ribosylglycohydrolase